MTIAVGDIVVTKRTDVPTRAKVLDIFRDRTARVQFLHSDFTCWTDVDELTRETQP